MKIGVIDVGGGTRGSFGAGVFDYCMHNNINFDYCIGISAGAANIASYAAHQEGRNWVFYTDYFARPEYMGVSNMLKTGDYIGLDYIYSSLSDHDGDYPLDWKTMKEDNKEVYIVATNANTGKPHYFTKDDMDQDQYDPIKASCCVPVANRPYEINSVPYFDGGISDPVPYKKAFEDGCDKLVLILTRPKDFRRVPKNDKVFAKLMENIHPEAAKDMANRSIIYNECVDACEELEKQGKVLIIAPDSIGNMKTLTKDKESIAELYTKGYEEAKKIKEFVL